MWKSPRTQYRRRAVSAALHTLQLGRPTLSQGPKIQSRHHLAPQRKLRSPNWNMKHQKSVKLGGPLKEKCLCITVTLVPFESKVFTHYNCRWGRFENKVAYSYITVAVGPLWKQGTLHQWSPTFLRGDPMLNEIEWKPQRVAAIVTSFWLTMKLKCAIIKWKFQWKQRFWSACLQSWHIAEKRKWRGCVSNAGELSREVDATRLTNPQ